jgi:hypothetical protein
MQPMHEQRSSPADRVGAVLFHLFEEFLVAKETIPGDVRRRVLVQRGMLGVAWHAI